MENKSLSDYKVLALTRDLMDRSKLEAGIENLGAVKDVPSLLAVFEGEMLEGNSPAGVTGEPQAVILDLDCLDLQHLDWIQSLANRGIELVGYCRHTNRDTQKMARKAGCEKIFVRSVFFEKLKKREFQFAQMPS